jgi:hypothetical protein
LEGILPIIFVWIVVVVWSFIQSFSSFYFLWSTKYFLTFSKTSSKLALWIWLLWECCNTHVYSGHYMNWHHKLLKLLLFHFFGNSWPPWPLGTWIAINHWWLQAY